jgi:ERCC4-type nuclease
MRLIVDEREHNVFEKIHQVLETHSSDNGLSTVDVIKEVLPLGDFILETNGGRILAIIERKSLTDLLASIKDSRYEEQSYRLSHCDDCSPSQVIYIIEGTMNTLKTPKEKRLVYSVLTSLHFFKGFCPMRTSSPQETAELLVWMADKIERNIHKGLPLFLDINIVRNNIVTDSNTDIIQNEIGEQTTSVGLRSEVLGEHDNIIIENKQKYCNVVKKVKKENVTPANIGEIMLCQVPGISSVTAIAIMKQFTSFFHLLESCKNNPNCLENLQYENNGKIRKISKSSISSIFKYFLP